MPCIPLRTPDGIRGIICSRGRRRAPPPCSVDGCAASSGFQCDYSVGRKRTCDRHLCAAHANEIAPDVHYCPEHFARWAREGAPAQTSIEFDQENETP
ncbi:MAG: hypothetical protein EPN70_17635 [Paraburkholderia sp.]|nr:MAG: hypothetical protein EPN70_17635 [Paraburkholderia sp.]TAM29864.1 MAG: hypothetical protein EPN59_11015 [Paraburkholderia sp.]